MMNAQMIEPLIIETIMIEVLTTEKLMIEALVIVAITTQDNNFYDGSSVTRKKSPNVYKSCPKIISLEKLKI